MIFDGSNKKLFLFGKLKDKIKKVGYRIKYKVGKKNQFDGIFMDYDGEEEEDIISDVSQL